MKNKVALITGGGLGIGKATAIAFGNKGAKVVVADVNVKEGENTVQIIKDAGREAIFIKADVSKEDEVKQIIEDTVNTYGRLDFAVNNAGIESIPTPTHELGLSIWEKTIAVNLTGVFLCMKYEIPAMLANKGGSIINMSSVSGMRGIPTMAAYAVSKHGVIGLTRTTAKEYSAQGIRINSVLPSAIHTELIDRLSEENPELVNHYKAANPIGRLGKTEEVANSVVWLCSDEASFVTGHTMAVDGGFLT